MKELEAKVLELETNKSVSIENAPSATAEFNFTPASALCSSVTEVKEEIRPVSKPIKKLKAVPPKRSLHNVVLRSHKAIEIVNNTKEKKLKLKQTADKPLLKSKPAQKKVPLNGRKVIGSQKSVQLKVTVPTKLANGIEVKLNSKLIEIYEKLKKKYKSSTFSSISARKDVFNSRNRPLIVTWNEYLHELKEVNYLQLKTTTSDSIDNNLHYACIF